MPKPKGSFFARELQAKKEFGVARERPQDLDHSFLKARRQSIYDTETVLHPLPEVVRKWDFMEGHLKIKSDDGLGNRGDPAFVATRDEFLAMMDDIKDEITLGFDLEGHMKYSFGNMISLMQISTFKTDYLLDPFKLHAEIRNEIKLKLEHPDTLLIVHGGANDILWLKGEYKIFPVGVFDTQLYEMVRSGKKQGVSFDKFKEIYMESCSCGKPRYDKAVCQLADWRVRPLPEKLKIYSSEDSFYVLLGWNEILKQNNTAVIQKALGLTKDLIVKPWNPPNFSYKTQVKNDKQFENFSDDELRSFDLLWKFQVYLGRLLDQNPAAFFPAKSLISIVKEKPVDRISLYLTTPKVPKTIPWQGHWSYLLMVNKGEEAFERFKKLRCNICKKVSHPAWACSEKQTTKTRKDFHDRFETPQQKIRQNKRRRVNKKLNKEKRESANVTSQQMEKSLKM